MKKILSIALCVAAVSVFGDTEAVLGGEIGVTAITNSFTNTIVAVSYNDLDPSVASGIAVSNFVKTTNLDADDQLAIFNGETYDTWVIRENGGVKYWDKNAVTFTVGSDGNLQTGEGESASVVTQTVGTGIWLIRQNPTDGSGNAKPFYIYGKPASASESEIKAGKWTLIGNPTQSEIAIGAGTVQGASEGDQIVVPVAPNGNLCYYTFRSSVGWQRTSVTNGVPVFKTDLKLGAGLGCWIKTTNDARITWSSNK